MCLCNFAYHKCLQQQGKAEILQTFQRLLAGLGDGASAIHKDIYKLAKSCLTDKSMSVRCAAARVCNYVTTGVLCNGSDNNIVYPCNYTTSELRLEPALCPGVQ